MYFNCNATLFSARGSNPIIFSRIINYLKSKIAKKNNKDLIINQQVSSSIGLLNVMSLLDKETNARILISIDSKFQVDYKMKLRMLISSKKFSNI
jgi:hypothetical protein